VLIPEEVEGCRRQLTTLDCNRGFVRTVVDQLLGGASWWDTSCASGSGAHSYRGKSRSARWRSSEGAPKGLKVAR
jgi:hypothetical protein